MNRKYYFGQMSESIIIGILLSLSGGLQDAYTYFCRDKVYANAQTGNIIQLGSCIAEGDWQSTPRYIIPVLAFAGGVFLSQQIHHRFVRQKGLHWRQIVLLSEIIVLAVVGLMPVTTMWNMIANFMVSFSCAMQADSFRTVKGISYASTMCIGNIRSAMDSLSEYTFEHKKVLRTQSLLYAVMLLSFLIGAVLGYLAVKYAGSLGIWFCYAALLPSFLLMFIRGSSRPDVPDEGELSDEIKEIGAQVRHIFTKD